MSPSFKNGAKRTSPSENITLAVDCGSSTFHLCHTHRKEERQHHSKKVPRARSGGWHTWLAYKACSEVPPSLTLSSKSHSAAVTAQDTLNIPMLSSLSPVLHTIKSS